MTQQANVNTEFSESQANRASFALLSNEAIQQQLTDIDQQARDIGTLMLLMLQQIDGIIVDRPDIDRALTAIECLGKSVLRNAALIVDAHAEISMQLEGGAA